MSRGSTLNNGPTRHPYTRPIEGILLRARAPACVCHVTRTNLLGRQEGVVRVRR